MYQCSTLTRVYLQTSERHGADLGLTAPDMELQINDVDHAHHCELDCVNGLMYFSMITLYCTAEKNDLLSGIILERIKSAQLHFIECT